MASLAELLAQKAALDQLIIDTQRAERERAVAQVRELMAQFGLTMADIGGAPRPAPLRQSRSQAPSKVAPKYRHPDTGETWSGRGLQPKWLKAALADGRSLSDFAL
ncbi:MAG: hypothetical protein RL227_621 [Pseudomonadota bacterium]|jgi:DNA-binding protein H-NS